MGRASFVNICGFTLSAYPFMIRRHSVDSNSNSNKHSHSFPYELPFVSYEHPQNPHLNSHLPSPRTHDIRAFLCPHPVRAHRVKGTPYLEAGKPPTSHFKHHVTYIVNDIFQLPTSWYLHFKHHITSLYLFTFLYISLPAWNRYFAWQIIDR